MASVVVTGLSSVTVVTRGVTRVVMLALPGASNISNVLVTSSVLVLTTGLLDNVTTWTIQ